jgi:hypothetical protein
LNKNTYLAKKILNKIIFLFLIFVTFLIKKKFLPFRTSILKFIGYKILIPSSIVNKKFKKIKLFNECHFKSLQPNFNFSEVGFLTGIYPSIYARILHDACASPYSPAHVIDDCIHLPHIIYQQQGRVLIESANLFFYNSGVYIYKVKKYTLIEKAIHCGVSGVDNWYHFIWEFLPKLYVLRFLDSSYDDFPILLPDLFLANSTFAEAISCFIGSRKIIYCARSTTFKINELVYIDDITRTPFNLNEGSWPKITDYGFHSTLLLEYAHQFRRYIFEDNESKNTVSRLKNIFLARSKVNRNYNQDELIIISSKYGFSPIYLENYSLKEQAFIISNSNFIIGPSGAAWSNLIFAEEEISALSWMPSLYSESSVYSNIANLLGHNIIYIESFYSEFIKTTGYFSKASYLVCPDKFEKALVAMLN